MTKKQTLDYAKNLISWPKTLTWDSKCSDEEKIDNLKYAIELAKFNGNEYLSDSIIIWENQIKELEKKENMDNKEITAEWARKTIETQIDIESETQLNICLTEIKKAVEKNNMSVNIYIDIHKSCIDDLKKRGFTVKQEHDQRDGDNWIVISW